MDAESIILKRDFKGVWIPAGLYLDKKLNWAQKVLIVEIDSLDNSEKGCFAKNDYFAIFLQKSPGTIQNMISVLKKKGYIEQCYFDGRNRGLRSIIHTKHKAKVTAEPTKSLELTQGNDVPEQTKSLVQTNRNSVLYYIITNTGTITKQFTMDEAFDFFWNMYDYKKNKVKTKKLFLKLKVQDAQNVFLSLNAYILQTPEKKYRLHPSTYLRNQRWLDDNGKPEIENHIANKIDSLLDEQYQ